MKAILSGLPELLPENQTLLGRLILFTMSANNFLVDGVKIEFTEGED